VPDDKFCKDEDKKITNMILINASGVDFGDGNYILTVEGNNVMVVGT